MPQPSTLLTLAIGTLALAAVAQARGDSLAEVSNSQVCGPRCAQHLLAYFGQKLEFIDLVREIQGAALDQPADLARIKSVLVAYGTHTAALRVDPADLDRLAWQGPVLVHYAPLGESPGHFVVLYPASSARGGLYVWDGLHGAGLVPTDQVVSLASGVILLTSAEPIVLLDDGILVPREWRRWRWIVFLGILSSLGVCFVAAHRVRGASASRNVPLLQGFIS